MTDRVLDREELLRIALDLMPDAYVLLTSIRDDDGRVIDFTIADANEAAVAYHRMARHEIIGKSLLDLLPGHRISGLVERSAEVVQTGEPFAIDGLHYDNESLGGPRRIDVRIIRTGDGVSLAWRDVTEQRRASEALARSEERFRMLAENSSDVVVHVRDDLILWASPSLNRILAWPPEQVVDRPLAMLLHPDSVEVVVASHADVTRPSRYRCRLLSAAGDFHWFEGIIGPMIRPDGHIDGQVLTLRIIDAEVEAERELERRALFDELTGLLSRGEALSRIGALLADPTSGRDKSAVLFCDLDKFKDINDTFGHAAGDEVLKVVSSRVSACLRSSDVVARLGGDELLVLLTGLHGVDDAVRVAEKIRAAASTPIPFEDRYIHATVSIGVAMAVPGEDVDGLIARADAAMLSGKGGGRDRVIAVPSPVRSERVIVIDDDPFMLAICEELLQQVGVHHVTPAADGATALSLIDESGAHPDLILCDVNMAGMDGIELLRHLSNLGYRGGLIIMSGSETDVVSAVGDLARVHGLNVLASLRKPLTPTDLVRALEGLDRLASGPPAFPASTPELLTADEVREGIAGGCVAIHLQPKVRVTDGRVTGAEALLRWQDPVRGPVSPMSVVPVAEASGLIEDLTVEIFRRALDVLVGWRDSGLDLRLSVNLSTENLVSLDLPDRFADMAAAAGISPQMIVLEVTESRLMDRLSVSLEVIGRLRLKGFGISVDDYGMGYSNLRKLKQLPITELKVDRSFVTDADADNVLRVILESSVALGRSLGLTVVAEGVETQEVWDLLEELGCEEAQGYFIARPMPVAEFGEWLQAWDTE